MRPNLRRDPLLLSALLAAWPGPPAQAQEPPGVVADPIFARPSLPPPTVAPCPPEPRGHRIANCLRKLRGRPEETFRPPLGANLYAVNNVQVANGDAARLVLHHYDFLDGTNQLNDRGRYRLAWIAAQLPRVAAPVFIEATPDEPGLDEARRLGVEAALASGSIPVLPGLVRVGRPNSRALMGPEAELVYLNRLATIEAKSPPVGSNAGPGAFAGGGAPPGFGR